MTAPQFGARYCPWCHNDHSASAPCTCPVDCGESRCPVPLMDDYTPPPVPKFEVTDGS